MQSGLEEVLFTYIKRLDCIFVRFDLCYVYNLDWIIFARFLCDN